MSPVRKSTNIPDGPVEKAPKGAIKADPAYMAATCQEALHAALEGVDVGEFDGIAAAWLAIHADPSVVATVCSWLLRVRALNPKEPGEGQPITILGETYEVIEWDVRGDQGNGCEEFVLYASKVDTPEVPDGE